MQNVFETTPQELQLSTAGRAMMDFSEEYGKIHGLGHLAEEGFRVLNELSRVGSMLTRFGNTFGTNNDSFTDADKQLIAKFLKKELDIPSK
jgi:hypothetical protein